MKNAKLTNSFHRTSVTVRVPESWGDVWGEIQYRAMNGGRADRRRERKIRRILCGMSDCECGIVR